MVGLSECNPLLSHVQTWIDRLKYCTCHRRQTQNGAPEHSMTSRFLILCRKEFKIGSEWRQKQVLFRLRERGLETGSGVSLGPAVTVRCSPDCNCHRVPQWKKQKYMSKWMWVNSLVSCAPQFGGFLYISKGRLFLNSVAPNSVSAFWLWGCLVPDMVCSESVTLPRPLLVVSNFIIMVVWWALRLVSGQFFIHLELMEF